MRVWAHDRLTAVDPQTANARIEVIPLREFSGSARSVSLLRSLPMVLPVLPAVVPHELNDRVLRALDDQADEPSAAKARR